MEEEIYRRVEMQAVEQVLVSQVDYSQWGFAVGYYRA